MAPKADAKDKEVKEKKEKKDKEEKKEKKEKKEKDGDEKEKKARKLPKDSGGGFGDGMWASTQGSPEVASSFSAATKPQDKRDKIKEEKEIVIKSDLASANDALAEALRKKNQAQKEKVQKEKEKLAKQNKQAKKEAEEEDSRQRRAEEAEEFEVMDPSGLGNFMEKGEVMSIMKGTIVEANSSSGSRCQVVTKNKSGEKIFIDDKKAAFGSMCAFSMLKGYIYVRGHKGEPGFSITLSRPATVFVIHSELEDEGTSWLRTWQEVDKEIPEVDVAAELVTVKKRAYKDPNSRTVNIPKPPASLEALICFVLPDFAAKPFGAVEEDEEEALERKRREAAEARDKKKAEKAPAKDEDKKKAEAEEKLQAALEKKEKGEKLTRKEKEMIEKHEKGNKEWTNEEDMFEKDTTLNAFSISLPGGKNDPPSAGDNFSVDGFTIMAPKQTLFNNAKLTIVQGKRYGILGPNGQGKTTLLRFLAAREFPIPKNWDVILVEQEAKASDNSAVDEVLAADTRTADLLKREAACVKKLEEAEIRMNEGTGEQWTDEDWENARVELTTIAADLEAYGADSAEARVRKILCGLGFTNGKPEEDRFSMDRPVVKFSGGWRMRISLAKALFLEPKLLMLDEPTNHLDLDAVLWLDHYLSEQYPHAVIVVSHDADFLDNIVTDILHLEDKKLNHYTGDYTQFRKMHQQTLAKYDADFKKQQDALKRHKKSGKSKEDAEELVKKQFNIESLDNLMEKRRDYIVKFRFIGHGKDQTIGGINVTEAAFSYDGKEPYLLDELEIGVDCASRIAIVGPNGAGKTTLLNMMMEKLECCKGDVTISKGLRVRQYHQHFEELLPLEKTPVDYLLYEYNLPVPEEARSVLGQFGLPGSAHFTQIGNLSGGQKARVAFAALMLQKPHIMILDEPTNHLDIESVEALSTAVAKFNGGLVLVSHDARLIQEVDCDLWVVEDGTCYKFEKGFDGYRDKVLDQLDKRQEEVERLEKKRREERAKQRAKHQADQETMKKKKAEAEAAAKKAAKEEEKKKKEEEAAAKKKEEEAAAKKAEEEEAKAEPEEEEESGGADAALVAELRKMKKSELRKRAKAEGVAEEKLDEAEDADDEKAALVDLIVEKIGAASKKDDDDKDAAALEAMNKLKAELKGLKKSELRKRAKAEGVSADDLDAADDADDPKEAFIELIVAKAKPKAEKAEEEEEEEEDEKEEEDNKKAEAEAEAQRKAAEEKAEKEAREAKQKAEEESKQKKGKKKKDKEPDEKEDEPKVEQQAPKEEAAEAAAPAAAPAQDLPPLHVKGSVVSVDEMRKKGHVLVQVSHTDGTATVQLVSQKEDLEVGQKVIVALEGAMLKSGKVKRAKVAGEFNEGVIVEGMEVEASPKKAQEEESKVEDAEKQEAAVEDANPTGKVKTKKESAWSKEEQEAYANKNKFQKKGKKKEDVEEEEEDVPKDKGKKGKKGDSEDEAEAAPKAGAKAKSKAVAKSKSKKGKRGKDDDSEEEEEAPAAAAKAKGKKGKRRKGDDSSEDEEAAEAAPKAAPKAKGKKGRKGKDSDEEDDEEDEPAPKAKAKPSKGKSDDEDNEDEDAEDDEEEEYGGAPVPKAKAKAPPAPKAKSKRGKGKKDDDDDDDDVPKGARGKKGRRRGGDSDDEDIPVAAAPKAKAKAKAQQVDEDSDDAPPQAAPRKQGFAGFGALAGDSSEEESDDESEEEKPPPKKKEAPKKKAKADTDSDEPPAKAKAKKKAKDDSDSDDAPKTKAKAKKKDDETPDKSKAKKKAKADSDSDSPPAKTKAKKKAKDDSDSDDAPPKTKAKKKTKADSDSDDPPAKKKKKAKADSDSDSDQPKKAKKEKKAKKKADSDSDSDDAPKAKKDKKKK